jgi:hypothetical protein
MTDPTQHPRFRDVAEWLVVPGRTFALNGVIYKVVEDEPDLLPAALDVIEAVRQWGPYTPRRVTRALQAFDAAVEDRQP